MINSIYHLFASYERFNIWIQIQPPYGFPTPGIQGEEECVGNYLKICDNSRVNPVKITAYL